MTIDSAAEVASKTPDMSKQAKTRAQPSGGLDPKEIDEQLVDKLRELVRKEYSINQDKYCADHYEDIVDPTCNYTCWRYLKQNDLDLHRTLEAIKSSLVWRKENSIDNNLDASEQAKEFWLFGPLHFTGTSVHGSDVLYLIGRDYRKANQNLHPYILKFAANLLFSWDLKNKHNLRQMTVVFDTSSTGYRNVDLEFMRWIIAAADNLPCRFHSFYVVGIPMLLVPIVRLVISWLPHRFSSITHCGSIQDLVGKNIDAEEYPSDVGGAREDSYRLAPLEAKWASDIEQFEEQKILKAMEESLLHNLSLDKREKLVRMQLQYEDSLAKKK